MGIVSEALNEPAPLRRLLRAVIRRGRLGSPHFRYSVGAIDRPHYAYLVLQAATLAHRLGHDRVSVAEFGVAGGAGLLALEAHAEWIEKIIPVKIEIYGFDTGEGLPEAQDYRDLQYHWKPGFFRMDEAALRARLKRATLVLGDIKDTIRTFAETYSPAPLGGVAHDFDFYSSTVEGLKLFDASDAYLLPRIVCYFDDVIGGPVELYNDFTGERAAIHDFNIAHTDRKLSPLYYLTAQGSDVWRHHMWSLHNFEHAQYGQFVSEENQQLPL